MSGSAVMRCHCCALTGAIKSLFTALRHDDCFKQLQADRVHQSKMVRQHAVSAVIAAVQKVSSLGCLRVSKISYVCSHGWPLGHMRSAPVAETSVSCLAAGK